MPVNAFDTGHYREQRRRQSGVFSPEYRSDRPERVTRLEDGLTVRTRYYRGTPPFCGYQLHASESVLCDAGGKALYTWQNLNDSGEFCRLIRHQNGNRYLVFRPDLYGYGVLELETGRDCRYLPLESEPEDRKDFRETFLWTGAEYHRGSGLLAVPGCYWACPNSTVVLDFRDPLTPQERWLELHEVIDPGYDRYDDLDFAGWDDEKGLLLRGFSVETVRYEPLSVPIPTLWERLAEGEGHGTC